MQRLQLIIPDQIDGGWITLPADGILGKKPVFLVALMVNDGGIADGFYAVIHLLCFRQEEKQLLLPQKQIQGVLHQILHIV